MPLLVAVKVYHLPVAARVRPARVLQPPGAERRPPVPPPGHPADLPGAGPGPARRGVSDDGGRRPLAQAGCAGRPLHATRPLDAMARAGLPAPNLCFVLAFS